MRPHITIPAVSLDSFLDQGRRIDLIKIDVQGYEYQVLCGARRVLKENANIVLLIEFWPYGLHKAGVEPKALMRLIERLGFTWRSIDGRSVCSSGVELLDPKREDHYCNLLLVKSERRGSS